MKEHKKTKNYRAIYKKYYGIDFDSNYVVHHLDFDRGNNDISNLLLLLKELHQRYHFYLSALGGANWKSGKVTINTRIDKHIFQMYSDEMLAGFLETLKECENWMMYKERLNFQKFNTI